MTTDPNIIRRASAVASLISNPSGTSDTLEDRARGVMLGLAVGNLLGLPVESRWYSDIEVTYPGGVRDIDPEEIHRPMDDDLAQAVDLGESLVDGGDYVTAFAGRLVRWRRENGRGIGMGHQRGD